MEEMFWRLMDMICDESFCGLQILLDGRLMDGGDVLEIDGYDL